eukprot:355983-Chlamydomonas_euryale.AAC.1
MSMCTCVSMLVVPCRRQRTGERRTSWRCSWSTGHPQAGVTGWVWTDGWVPRDTHWCGLTAGVPGDCVVWIDGWGPGDTHWCGLTAGVPGDCVVWTDGWGPGDTHWCGLAAGVPGDCVVYADGWGPWRLRGVD